MLCDSHAKSLAGGALTHEQVITRSTAPVATLITPWGDAFPIDDNCTVGRSPTQCEVALVHASVSAIHASIKCGDDGWTITDRASRNGTMVDGQRIGTVKLLRGARLTFGDVSLLFIDDPLRASAQPQGPGRTVPSRRDQIIFAANVVTETERAMSISQRIEGGVVGVEGNQLELGNLEFRLIQILVEAYTAVTDPAFAFVSWQELATQLRFRSQEADSDNVRELVRRVRRKLKDANLDDLIESRHRTGYRLRYETTEQIL